MGLIGWARGLVRGQRAPAEQRGTTYTGPDWWGTPATSSGATVTTETARGVTTVLACARVIAEGVAAAPLRVLRPVKGNPDRSEEATSSPAWRVLTTRPNEWQTAFEFREALTMHAVLAGDGFAFKVVGDSGRLLELLPLMPGQVTVEQMADYSLRYHVADARGRVVGVFGREQMLHLRGPVWDSARGMNIVRQAREAIGLAQATETNQAKLQANGGRVSGILSVPGQLSPEARKALRDAWQEAYSGAQNAYKTAVVDNGAKYETTAMTSVEADTLATRRFQIEEICRAMNVFPQIVMHSDKTSTYASAEAFFAAHVRQTLRPWLTRWEQVLDRDVLDDRGPLFCRFDTRELTKAAARDRAQLVNTMVSLGIYTRNEVRDMEGLEPLPGLDEPLTPLNMQRGSGGGDSNGDGNAV